MPRPSGEGAQRYGGLWNPSGVPAVYAAENRALCILERLVQMLTRIETSRSDLPEGWDSPLEIEAAQSVGAHYLKGKTAAVLKGTERRCP